ncbi:hypothetical protein F4779DRAFT_623559 [Xylariaceae sp. FL0662B]|nr:hypothetical protein F4779DRAFT_623559 [Xylariaceae sp. FL0662B]
MAYRDLDEDLAYGERWDRDRFVIESDRNRHGDERDRFEEHDRRYTRGPRDHVRETSLDRRYARRSPPRPWDDDYGREKRYRDDGPRWRRSPSPDLDRRTVIDREREYRDPSPVPRPGLLRRQSSLDIFDRRPPPRFYERDEYGPPARRGDYRPEPYKPIPLPRSRALPPPRIYAERDYDEIKILEPDLYGDDDYHAYPDRIREREIVSSRRRRDGSESRTSRSHTHRGSSVRSSSRGSTKRSRSSSSSDSGGTKTTVTVKSEYPKKGKTRIPRRLVSVRALVDLQYPYTEEGQIIVVLKALGQQNIDDLLKLSEEYKKSDLEVTAARSVAGEIEAEREKEVFTIAPPPSAPPAPAPPAPPTIIHTPAPVAPAQAAPVEVVKETVIREGSPTRSIRSGRSHSTSTSTRAPLVVSASPREYSDEVALGPLALVGDRRRSDREIKMEIARLEAERDLVRSERRHHHHSHSHSHSHSRHRSHSHSTDRELVRAERLPTGELVLYEEEVKVEEPRRGVRIEKDKKGRMSISVPKYR